MLFFAKSLPTAASSGRAVGDAGAVRPPGDHGRTAQRHRAGPAFRVGTARRDGRDVVFVSNAAGGLLLEKDEELQRYSFVFDHLRATALDPDDTVAMIARLAKEL